MDIEVSDNGMGIPEHMQTEIFELFAQVKSPVERAQESLGIGLALVQDILVAHGGGVEVRTSTDVFEHGTTIRLSLPTAVPRE